MAEVQLSIRLGNICRTGDGFREDLNMRRYGVGRDERLPVRCPPVLQVTAKRVFEAEVEDFHGTGGDERPPGSCFSSCGISLESLVAREPLPRRRAMTVP